MTTTTSKSVPRSRLNITYRTRIDGRVVQKELPLRLLVAGNFSGRGVKGLFGAASPGRDLPLLDRRPMYAIGKSGNLESVMKLMRIGLPVPDQLTHFRTFQVSGSANVKILPGGEDVLIQIEHAEIDGEAVLGEEGAAVVGASARRGFQGHLESFLAVEYAQSREDAGAWVPVKKDEVGLNGWLEPKRRSPREPAIMYEVTRLEKLQLRFDDDFDASLVPPGGLEQRVRLEATVVARHVIPLLDMKSFDPERIAETVPEIRRLLVLRWLVSQGRSMIASNSILRNKCKELLPSGEERETSATEDAGGSATPPLEVLRAAVGGLDAHGVFRLRSQETKPAPEQGAGEDAGDDA